MSRRDNPSDKQRTAELDPRSLRGLLDVEERDPRPTTVMQRDELLDLVNASAATPVSANAMPRALLASRERAATPEPEPVEVDVNLGKLASPMVVLAIVGVLIGMFAAIVLTAS